MIDSSLAFVVFCSLGSHGVWGLDDYHFLPFLFGSAQLRGTSWHELSHTLKLAHPKGHKYIKPKAIHDSEVVEEYSQYYMYFACIAFINSVRFCSLSSKRWIDQSSRSKLLLCDGTRPCSTIFLP